ncbi:MAG: DNA polymerase III subunit beta [Candidatus Levyibacteriota bacterium]|nr:MAG: DNA polymerase III subunit beta [Candidatus Levybacteria bacterium]
MKLQVLSEYLQKKLPFVFKAISSRTQLPVLQNMLLQARNGKLQISGTDLEIGITVYITANIEEEGEVTIPAKSFLELVNTLPLEKVTLETKDQTLIIVTKNTKSVFQTITADEFPKLYEEKGQEVAKLNKKDLQKALSYVLFAASIDTTRAALSGIYVKKDEEDEKKFFFVTTDGYRLSLKYNTIPFRIEKPLLISARVLKEVMMLKNGEDENIKIFMIEKSNQVLFEDGDTIIVGRLIEAQFPVYEKIIPQEVLTKATFDRVDLVKAVKMCSIFARESANIVKFSVTQDAIIVSANAPQTGENTVTVEAKVTGDDNEIAFNARYLLELLGTIEEEEMVVEMTNPTSPGVFKIKGDPTFLHLIMPIRVQTEV